MVAVISASAACVIGCCVRETSTIVSGRTKVRALSSAGPLSTTVTTAPEKSGLSRLPDLHEPRDTPATAPKAHTYPRRMRDIDTAV